MTLGGTTNTEDMLAIQQEVALTRLQLAELLLEHYPNEKSEALEHLDFAINEFRDMKMQPSLERALRHKEILGAWDGAIQPTARDTKACSGIGLQSTVVEPVPRGMTKKLELASRKAETSALIVDHRQY